MIWELRGTPAQNGLIKEALDRCDFPFDVLAPSLTREGRDGIAVDWEDLSRYARARGHGDEHSHIRDGDAIAHPIEREVDGRRRVLGLFYLPPHTRVVLDTGLEQRPALALEVFLAEAAHAVDYHHMTADERRAIVNLLHQEDLPAGADVADGTAFQLDGHTCSWFDVGPYSMWVGEAMMEAFTEAFAPTVPVTISLDHPTGPEQAAAVRDILLPAAVYGLARSGVFHDDHAGIPAQQTWPTRQAAIDDGRRPCRVCKP